MHAAKDQLLARGTQCPCTSVGDHGRKAMVLFSNCMIVHGSAWLVQLLGLEPGSAWLIGQGVRTLQQWDDTSLCLKVARGA